MADPDLIEQAIKRARELAAKMNNKPKDKDDKRPVEGSFKVTHAYEGSKNVHKASDQKSSDYKSSDHRNSDYKDPDHRNSDNNRGSDYRNSDHRNPDHRSSDHQRNSDNHRGSENDNGRGILSGANAFPQGQGAEDKIEIIIPHAVIGLVIGKGGENIKRIQNETGATVRVDPNTVDEHGNKVCTITGTKQAVEDARNQVANVIDNSASNKRPRLQPVEGTEVYKMKIPASRTGAIIGKGGETIKSIKQQSGCDIELDKGAKESGAEESVFIIRGTQDKILKARTLMEARLSVRGRDGDSHGYGPRDHGHGRGRDHGASKGVASGANATPVAPYPDLPSAAYTAATVAGQQPTTDASVAWAAYYAQLSMYNQAAAASPAAAAAAVGLPYNGQGLMGSAAAVTAGSQPTQAQPDLGQAAKAAAVSSPVSSGTGQPDYTDQWIEYYRANGRHDYAEQIIEMQKLKQKSL